MEGIYKEYNLVIIDTNGKLTMVPRKKMKKIIEIFIVL